MTTQDLITRVKLWLDDQELPRTFRDSEILIALNDAQREFAMRTLCLFDGEATADVIAQKPWVDLTEGTVWTIAAWLDDDTPLRVVTQHELELGYFELNGTETTSRLSNWRKAEGTPSFLVTDVAVDQARLVPRPVRGQKLFFERYRLPLVSMSVDPAVPPEIPSQFHTDLVPGALSYLFAVPDQEVYDAQMALDKRAAWEQKIQLAMQLLQTHFRTRMRMVTPPPSMAFVQPAGNTFGASQNVNTET